MPDTNANCTGGVYLDTAPLRYTALASTRPSAQSLVAHVTALYVKSVLRLPSGIASHNDTFFVNLQLTGVIRAVVLGETDTPCAHTRTHA